MGGLALEICASLSRGSSPITHCATPNSVAVENHFFGENFPLKNIDERKMESHSEYLSWTRLAITSSFSSRLNVY